MAFEFDLDQPEPVFVGPSDYVVDFTLGYDIDRGERVLMSVVLFKDDGGGDPHELAFGIRIQNVVIGVMSDYAFDHGTVQKYVPKGERRVVSLLVLASVRALITQVSPKIVAMETFEADLPPPAMGKYMSVCNHMGILGYQMIEYRRDGTDNKDYWLFTIPVVIEP